MIVIQVLQNFHHLIQDHLVNHLYILLILRTIHIHIIDKLLLMKHYHLK